MENKKLGYVSNEYDRETTAERSIENKQNIVVLRKEIEDIAETTNPDNSKFGDGTLVNTQQTKAESIVSNEDIRLNNMLDTKVNDLDFQNFKVEVNSSLEYKVNTIDFNKLTSEVDLNKTLITSNTNAINFNKENITINTNKISQLDGRVTDLEQDSGYISDVALLNYNREFNDITPHIAVFYLDKDFYTTNNIFLQNNGNSADNPGDKVNTILINTTLNLTIGFDFIVSNLLNQEVSFKVDVINAQNDNEVLWTKDFTFDFNETSSNQQTTGFNLVTLKELQQSDKIQLLIKSYNQTDFNLKGEAAITYYIPGDSGNIFDSDVVSTGDLGNKTVRGDIKSLETISGNISDEVDNIKELIYEQDGLTFIDGSGELKIEGGTGIGFDNLNNDTNVNGNTGKDVINNLNTEINEVKVKNNLQDNKINNNITSIVDLDNRLQNLGNRTLDIEGETELRQYFNEIELDKELEPNSYYDFNVEWNKDYNNGEVLITARLNSQNKGSAHLVTPISYIIPTYDTLGRNSELIIYVNETSPQLRIRNIGGENVNVDGKLYIKGAQNITEIAGKNE